MNVPRDSLSRGGKVVVGGGCVGTHDRIVRSKCLPKRVDFGSGTTVVGRRLVLPSTQRRTTDSVEESRRYFE